MAYFAIDALAISIHAPRTGSDDFLVIFRVACCISIHAPRTGSDAGVSADLRSEHNFNPRSPHGERQCSLPQPLGAFQISIHAPRTGSDLETTSDWCQIEVFQSTLPARGATAIACLTDTLANFNPRSPHGERPNCTSWGCYLQHNFNPRSPHGERLFSDAFDVRLQHFNPRSPHGERRVRIVFRW